jgi:hypothetical protein
MFYILLTTILAGAPMPPTLTAYETQGRYIAACQEYDQTGNQKAIEVDIGSGDVVGYLECSDYADDVAQEPAFRAWYATMAKRLHLNPDPDDRRHCYDYRGFYRAMVEGKAQAPQRRGDRFPSYWELACHDRT